MARADQPGPKRLVAYYISQPAQSCAGEELRLFLKDKLPDYMVPAAFVPLEVFPLTPSGKVDRQRMPAPGPSRLELAKDYLASEGLPERPSGMETPETNPRPAALAT
jgi:hypothetical protein